MRTLAILAAGAVSAALLTGCSVGGPERDPAATAQALLDALSAGDGTAALAVLSSPETPNCLDLLEKYGELSPAITDATVGDVTVDGDAATVEVTYTVPSASAETVVTLDLTMNLGEWEIDFPETFRIDLALPGYAMADVTVAADRDGPTRCSGDLYATLPAFPGVYNLLGTDPSGVFEPDYRADIVVTGDAIASADISDVFDAQYDGVTALIETQLTEFVYACASSGFTDASCPISMPTSGIGLAPNVADRVTGFPEVGQINNPTGESWSFIAQGGEYLYTENGVAQSRAINFLGTVTRDGEDLVVTLD